MSQLPDSFFRTLTTDEEVAFRTWARLNATPEHLAQASIYHPVVRREWTAMGVWCATGQCACPDCEPERTRSLHKCKACGEMYCSECLHGADKNVCCQCYTE